MKISTRIFCVMLSFLNLSLAEDRSETVVLHRLIENKWFDFAESRNGKLVSINFGDPLYNGIHDILAKTLDRKQLDRTVFVAGTTGGSAVRIDYANGLIFYFTEEPLIQNPFKKKGSVEFVFKIGALITSCYLENINREFEEIKELNKDLIISSEEALMLVLHLEYQSIKFTYDWYEKFAIPWSLANDVDPAIWKTSVNFKDFLESDRGKESRKRWAKWLQ